MNGALSAQTLYVNTNSVPVLVDARVYITMASSSILLTGTLNGTLRWVDARGRSRSVQMSAINLLLSTSRQSLNELIDVAVSGAVTFETEVLNIGLGSFLYDWCATVAPLDDFPVP